jgi:hypothetical protein
MTSGVIDATSPPSEMSGIAHCFPTLGSSASTRLLFLRSLLERIILRFFDLRVVNIKTLALWVLLGFLDVREGRPGIFRDNIYWRVRFLVGDHGYWEMIGEGIAFRACVIA